MPITTAVIGAAANAGASVINNTVSNLMKNKVYKAQVEQMQFQSRLAQLSASQQYDLAIKLQQANSDAEKLQILSDTVTKIDVATATGNAAILSQAVQGSSKSLQTTAFVVIAAVAALGLAYYFLNKDK
jgi:hypothetical protein